MLGGTNSRRKKARRTSAQKHASTFSGLPAPWRRNYTSRMLTSQELIRCLDPAIYLHDYSRRKYYLAHKKTPTPLGPPYVTCTRMVLVHAAPWRPRITCTHERCSSRSSDWRRRSRCLDPTDHLLTELIPPQICYMYTHGPRSRRALAAENHVHPHSLACYRGTSLIRNRHPP